MHILTYMGSSCGSAGKESVCNVGNPSSILGSGRSLGEGNVNPLQYSCLENSRDRGDWWATVHVVTESDTIEQLTLSHFQGPVTVTLFGKRIFAM